MTTAPGRRVAFATCAAEPALVADDLLAAARLARRGVAVEPLVWDAAPRDLSRYEAVIVRSCWDYHLKADAFAAWIAGLARAGVRVLNPPPVILGTLNKRYLLDYAKRGADIPRTRWLPRGGATPSAADVAALGERGVVVKPAVSLNGHETRRFSSREIPAARRAVETLLRTGDVLVQEFVPEIETRGETSLVFLAGEFSHAVRKRPRAGEFRVQREHGGSSAPVAAGADVVAQARAIVALAGTPLLYARVDGVEVGGRLVLMEFEAIDPLLFLGYDSRAPERFARAVLSSLR